MGTDTSPPPDSPELLLAQMRESYGRICYSHKTHEAQADLCHERHRRQRWLKIALTAVGSGTFLTSLISAAVDEQGAALVTSFIAVLVSIVGLADKTFQYGEDMQQHRETAATLWDLRESHLSLLVDLTSGALTTDAARERRDTLQAATGAVYRDAPRTTPQAYKRAQQALQMHGDLTFSPAEIDQLLPEALRGRQGGDHVAGE
jgi:hypothetical protein